MGQKFYAVRVGHAPGIYNSYDEARLHVERFKGAQHKSFTTRTEAEQYMHEGFGAPNRGPASTRSHQPFQFQGNRNGASSALREGQKRDSYRPQQPEENFTFRTSHALPPKPDFLNSNQQDRDSAQIDSYRPNRGGNYKNVRGHLIRTNPNRNNSRPYKPPQPSNRPLLSVNRASTPEQLEGMNGSTESRFKPLEDLSDSDEKAMDTDSDNSQGSKSPVRKKLRRPSTDQGDGDEVAKWSNPDPYTSLPPPAVAGKRTDFVKLIRKAKADVSKTKSASVEGDDFISLNDIKDDAVMISEDDDGGVPLNAPPEPQASNDAAHAPMIIHNQVDGKKPLDMARERYVQDHGKSAQDAAQDTQVQDDTSAIDKAREKYVQAGKVNKFQMQIRPRDNYWPDVPRHHTAVVSQNNSIDLTTPPPEPPPALQYFRAEEAYVQNGLQPQHEQPVAAAEDARNVQQLDVWPPPQEAVKKSGAQQRLERGVRGNANERKRKRDERREAKLQGKIMRGPNPNSRFQLITDGEPCPIVPGWRSYDVRASLPWFRGLPSSNSKFQLHQEICDFYEYVRPTEQERDVRLGVIERLQRLVDRCYGGAEIRYFGSFASSLYLPTGDMDLVMLSPGFITDRVPRMGTYPKDIRDFASRLRDQRFGIARQGSVLSIPKARVPIVKYVDLQSGLKVDVSFDNESGLQGNQTCKTWRHEYPAMPILVTLLKQYLAMREQNDVSIGGLGGFSIICLATTMVYHMQGQGIDTMQHLGEVLLTFLDYFGNKFDIVNHGLSMDPPSIIDKRTLQSKYVFDPTRPPRLCILDPNKPDNDISGGSRNIENIFKSFSLAHASLLQQMEDVQAGRSQSILQCILGGNYDSYELQRQHMRALSGQVPPAGY